MKKLTIQILLLIQPINVRLEPKEGNDKNGVYKICCYFSYYITNLLDV